MKKISNKLVSVIKEGKQVFSIIARKPTNFKESFLYPITSLPLNIASSNSSLNQTDKAGFRTCIIKTSHSVSRCFPPNAMWIYDGIAVKRALMPLPTYLNRCIELLLHITSPGNANVTLLNIVMDKYVEKSVKEGTRQQNGSKSGPSVHVLTLQQKKFQGRASATFS